MSSPSSEQLLARLLERRQPVQALSDGPPRRIRPPWLEEHTSHTRQHLCFATAFAPHSNTAAACATLFGKDACSWSGLHRHTSRYPLPQPRCCLLSGIQERRYGARRRRSGLGL